MKKTSSLFLFLFVLTAVKAQNWGLVWSDEFNATTINTNNWKFETGAGGWGNNELENYTTRVENAKIDNGNLMIIARKESYSGSSYASARMKTQGLQNWTYGKIEARIKLPATKGVWPAFWMLGENITQVSWPKCGEIDIMEHVNTEPKMNGTIHWDNNGHAQYGGDTACDVKKYHVYGIEWDNETIKWTLDGKKYKDANIKNNINGTDEFHKPFFILLNMAVGGNWPGSPDGTSVFPDTMFIDYVRVYQQTTDVAPLFISTFSATIFPNPYNGESNLQMDVDNAGEYSIRIFNSIGQLVAQEKIMAKENESIQLVLPVGNLPGGLYQVLIEGDDLRYAMKLER
ncbi:MAG TPA: family 16 glycosylhydrolase [Bacteroidia bacterium]|jgi:beta-glucanase (GH16 family)|nr:family 16 glycosylhydrolase [Bacteroidia bacterium]